MKRDFLKNLDLGEGARLPDAAIDAIMAEHGKAAGALQASVTSLTQERDTLNTRLAGMVEKSKYDEDTAALQGQITTLQNAAAVRDARDKVAAETGVPASLLTGETEEACRTQAQAMLTWRGNQPKYPATGDGGEVPPGGGDAKDAAWQTLADALNNN